VVNLSYAKEGRVVETAAGGEVGSHGKCIQYKTFDEAREGISKTQMELLNGSEFTDEEVMVNV